MPPVKVYSSVVFRLLTVCSSRHYLILEHPHHPEKKPHTHFPSLPILPLQLLTTAHWSAFCLCRLVFWIFHMNGIVSYPVSLVSGFLRSARCSPAFPGCGICQDFSPLWYQIMSLYVEAPSFVRSFISRRTFGYFKLLTLMNSAAVNIDVQVFVWTYVFNSVKYIRVDLLVPMVTLCVTSWGAAELLFSKASASFYIPSSSEQGFWFLCIFTGASELTFWLELCWWLWTGILRLGFVFSKDKSYWASFHALIGHLFIVFGEMPAQILCPFFNWILRVSVVELCILMF